MNKKLLILFFMFILGTSMIYLGLQENNYIYKFDNNPNINNPDFLKHKNEVLKEVISNEPQTVYYDNNTKTTYIYYKKVSPLKIRNDVRSINESN